MDKNSAVFGGTFNPIHLGHLEMIKFVLENANINNIILVPSGNPPFKKDLEVASSTDRLNMIKIALNDFKELYGENLYNRVSIDTYELEKFTTSYTSETIKYLKNKYNIKGMVSFIIGRDILVNLSRWHDFDYLKNNVKFILLKRKTDIDTYNYLHNLIEMGCVIEEYYNDEINVSSTDIRNGCFEGVSNGVRKYIMKNNLYR